MWQPWIRVGKPDRGHYVFLNHMKVLDEQKCYQFEHDVWLPMVEEWIRQGVQSGWQLSIVRFPAVRDLMVIDEAVAKE
jgi:hypothetical protein